MTTAEGIERAIRYIWESAQSDRLRSYMRRVEEVIVEDEDEAGTGAAVRVALIVQRMIASEVSGILFTRNPVTNTDERVIEATWGLGEAVASGYVTPDFFRMNRNGEITEATVSMKEVAVRAGQCEGTIQDKLTDNVAHALCLTAKQCSDLNRVAAKCEQIFGPDIDIRD